MPALACSRQIRECRILLQTSKAALAALVVDAGFGVAPVAVGGLGGPCQGTKIGSPPRNQRERSDQTERAHIQYCSRRDRESVVAGNSLWSQSPQSFVRSGSNIRQKVGEHEYLARRLESVSDDVGAFEADPGVEGTDQKLELVGTH